jgi:hypothetical protein
LFWKYAHSAECHTKRLYQLFLFKIWSELIV